MSKGEFIKYRIIHLGMLTLIQLLPASYSQVLVSVSYSREQAYLSKH